VVGDDIAGASAIVRLVLNSVTAVKEGYKNKEVNVTIATGRNEARIVVTIVRAAGEGNPTHHYLNLHLIKCTVHSHHDNVSMQTVVATISTTKVAILTIVSSVVSVPSFPSTVVMTPQMNKCVLKVTITSFYLHQRFTLHLLYLH
jgi:hypothetical protein